MLQLYRRHVKACRFWTGKSTNGNRRDHNCRCPVWVDGYLAGKRVNKTLGLRDWTRANEIIRDWEIAGSIQPQARAGTAVGEACDAFMADVGAQRLSESSLKKYSVLLINQHGPEDSKKFSPSLLQFCAGAGLQFTTQITLTELTRFRGQWKDGPLSGGKKLERLRAVGRFFVDRGWWSENLALRLKRPKIIKDAPTMPYTRDEMSALLSACRQYTDWHGHAGQENACRLRAFIMFARYSALRVSDLASCAVDRLSGNRLFLDTQKTGVPVYVPLPPFVVEAPRSVPSHQRPLLVLDRRRFKRDARRKLAPHLPPPVQNRRRARRSSSSVPGHACGGIAVGRGTHRARLRAAGPFVGKDHRAPLLPLGQGATGATRIGPGAGLAERSHCAGGDAWGRHGVSGRYEPADASDIFATRKERGA
jgi:integrase